MGAAARLRKQDREFGRALERHIDESTRGRLFRVRIELAKDRLIVRGSTHSYYVKQLALQAVSDLGDSVVVELDIGVGVAAEIDADGDDTGGSQPIAVRTGLVGRADAEGSGAPISSELG